MCSTGLVAMVMTFVMTAPSTLWSFCWPDSRFYALFKSFAATKKLRTHSISHSAVTCLSTTCLSFTGSPSSSCKSPSPNREPRPIICLFLPNANWTHLMDHKSGSPSSPHYFIARMVHFLIPSGGLLILYCTCSLESGPGCLAEPAAADPTGVLWCLPEQEVDSLK